ncbi:phage head closure protein [Pseudomonas sp. JS3066]|uniref:phage head closure protein n=1 Tax=Pseudomonas sp. JS3066 TaxID=3090665 RepID=UPI003FA7577B
MRAGKLRHRITFQARQLGADDFGQPSQSWLEIATVWASVEPISGRELLAAQQVHGETTHRIRCRYLEGITSSARVLFGSRVFDIQTLINSDELGASLEILAKEGPTDG